VGGKSRKRYGMKFLHTSDWHLGKKTEGRDRLAEQRAVLEEITVIAEREKVDVILVAGDVFDTYVPSSEAEQLFFDAVYKMAGGGRKVVIISGNHDDALRLSAPNPFAVRAGIFIAGGQDNDFGGAKHGKGYVIVENSAGERAFIGLMPYPNEARFKEVVNEDESYNDKMRRWMNTGLSQNTEGLPSVLVGHFYTLGGKVSESERNIDLGGARAVDKDILPDCNYIALGHLHKRQVASKSKNAYYCGAILEYAFDEAGYEKSVNLFEIIGGETTGFKQVPLTAGKKLVRLEADGYDDALAVLALNAGAYAELTLKLGAPLTDLQVRYLKNNFPDMISLNLVFEEAEKITAESKKSLTDEQLFNGYFKSKYGKEPSPDLTETFLEIMNEADKT